MTLPARFLMVLIGAVCHVPAQAPSGGAHATLLAADRALVARVATQGFASTISDAMTGNAVLVWPAAAVARRLSDSC